jgi:transcriptional regulator with AAA-type ATPase domain/polyferredoxin
VKIISDLRSYLIGLRLFEKLPDRKLDEIVSFSTIEVYEKGQVILGQDEPPGNFFVLCVGSAEVILQNDEQQSVLLARLYPNDHFGEMSILTGAPTSAAIIAAENCKVLVVNQQAFARMISLVSEISDEVIRTLSFRLKQVNLGVLDAHNKEIAWSDILSDKGAKYGEIVGKSREIKDIKAKVPKWASGSGSPLYIVGERGTGRELIAHSVHVASERKGRPFISVDCGDLIVDETEMKLFGRLGYLELANGGTLLLKDIDALAPAILNQLWDVMAQKLVDIKLIMTSQENIAKKNLSTELNHAVIDNLFTRILQIPPLRKRKKDLPALIDFILEKLALKHHVPVPAISKEAVEKLISYDYHYGNVTELEEVLERALLLTSNSIISGDEIFLGKIYDKKTTGFNLLRWSPVMQAIQKRIYPEMFQVGIAAIFVYIMVTNFIGTETFGLRAESLVWSIWWPSLVLLTALGGRLFCSVCPISCIATGIQKWIHFDKPVPAFLKKYDYLLVTVLFLLIFWAEEVSNMRTSPWATGLLLVTILSGAVLAAIIFQRQTWCRHICPLGGMIGVCSMAAPLELRSNTELCMNKCTTHNCFKGTEEIPGCPLFQHVPFIDNNQVCKLCMKCVRSCPNGSVQLNLRLPTQEIRNLSRVNRGMVVFVMALLLMIFPLYIFDQLRLDMNNISWLTWFTISYWSTGLIAVVGTWLFIRKRLNDDHFLPVIRLLYALTPVALALHIIYHLQFVPALPDLAIVIVKALPHARTVEMVSIPILTTIALGFVAVSLGISLVCIWRIKKEARGLEEEGLAG